MSEKCHEETRAPQQKGSSFDPLVYATVRRKIGNEMLTSLAILRLRISCPDAQ
jgi:hypothetical protein